MATSQPLGFFVEDAAAALVAIIIALYYSWKLTLVIVATVPILAIGTRLLGKTVEAAVEGQKKTLMQASKYSHSAIANVDTVKVYNMQEQEAWQFHVAVKHAASFYLVQARSMAMIMGFTRFITIVMFVQGFWYGLTLIKQGTTPGVVLTTFYSVLLGVQSAESLLPQWMILARGMSAGETLKHLNCQMEHGRKVTTMGGSLKPVECFGNIEILKVCD